MSNKKYYWLKLTENFFEEDTIVWLEEQENGKDYVNFYLKLLLKSIRDNGKLVRFVGERVIPYDTKSLAKLTNTNPDTVAVAMKTFIDIGLVESLDTGELYLTQINELIGSETRQAGIMRRKRALEKEKVTMLPIVTKCYTEIEKEKELEIDNNNVESKDSTIPFKSIISYLNEKANRQFRLVESNKKFIRSRWNEGYALEDFKQAIDNKASEWLDTDMEKYLQPSTLFGTKFDNYLNQAPKAAAKKEAIMPVYEEGEEITQEEAQEVQEWIKEMIANES